MNALSSSERKEKYRPRYVRWSKIRIQQMGYVINLLIGLASGILLYNLIYLSNIEKPYTSYSGIFIVISIISLFLTIFLGIVVSINRLYDFRYSAKINKQRMDGKGKNKIDETRGLIRKHSNCTWSLFIAQTISFIIGIVLLVLHFLIKIAGY